MILVDDELQEKIDKLNEVQENFLSDVLEALTIKEKVAEAFGSKRTGEQGTQSKSEVQEKQAGSDHETRSSDTFN